MFFIWIHLIDEKVKILTADCRSASKLFTGEYRTNNMCVVCLSNQIHRGFYTSVIDFRNEYNFWNVHGIMNTLDLLQS